MTLFSSVQLAPKDPIFGLTEAYVADQKPDKVNLGVGVYFTDEGKIPLLKAVLKAEEELVAKHLPRGYIPIDGPNPYNQAVQNLLFGAHSPLIKDGRVVTAECIGGTGALRVGADFIERLNLKAPAAISNPTWENHRGIFEAAGFEVRDYSYFDSATHGVDFAGMVKSLESYPKHTTVVLHACCHNPTGADITEAQWRQVIEICKSKELIPFLDMAYQGFADGIDQDGIAVRLFADSGMSFFVSSSFSKSFSLYGERVGALSIITQSKEESNRVLSQLKRVIRTNYSNPPTHGGAIVAAVLNTPELRQMWEEELATMRNRIKKMRHDFVIKLAEAGVKEDLSFIEDQRGMFSYSGLTAEQVERLQKEDGIYALSTGRICVAALNTKNIDKVARAIARVLAA
ncbi:aspartate/tyrosine/aromatic aminotransferase [Polynucleobacter paneuropaeus]|uniref:Aminotransferase n=1 Tax=Polynucleobacter paneuropaeus TaxID=2527775 RepID=A0A9Q2WHN7_9BURK|nr:aspartate/tyrosine/aromatic aminotransferase [Polynucleobacter paneuropaeus]MBT8550475.1 aspartate/tyrosine/aromatic aminotransferase [Polynucleobacter paneuropaeus]MBT8605048.1 aspartate/tyrosine/aromatic aminotransferase [Polynucleobacter paneuropaeus]MBT8636762.1 aspartate/tyrosine/aromatic aminotransferase [Polynucleobacter paneuropaeus]MBT8638698.1 aspartate/tyrosine/aromatic aminotransferase [Polynucleobacter paneuropaeus]